MTKISYTFWKGIKNTEELQKYIKKNKDCPECEMFQILSKGDKQRIKGKGFIESAPCDDELFEELPKTLAECI